MVLVENWSACMAHAGCSSFSQLVKEVVLLWFGNIKTKVGGSLQTCYHQFIIYKIEHKTYDLPDKAC